jgi:hypothetical protein
LPILPISVFAPVARTSARPRPWTTIVPDQTNGRLSPPGLPISAVMSRQPPDFMTWTDSPVSSDSSTDRFVQERRTPSAGTRSPSASNNMSPVTTSRPAMRFCSPDRMTFARGLDRSLSASSARSVLRSW